jgi:hypothetical protein
MTVICGLRNYEMTNFVNRGKLALGPGVHSASNRKEYQKHNNNNVTGE